MKTGSTYSVINKEGKLEKMIWKEKEIYRNKNRNIWKEMDVNVGFLLLTPILVGVILGLTVDNWLKTKPIFTIVLILLGTVGSFYNLIRLVNKENAENKH